MTKGEKWVAACALIFGQSDNSTGPIETSGTVLNIDGVYNQGEFSDADLAALRRILSNSPIMRRPEFRRDLIQFRDAMIDGGEEITLDRFWWWPENW